MVNPYDAPITQANVVPKRRVGVRAQWFWLIAIASLLFGLLSFSAFLFNAWLGTLSHGRSPTETLWLYLYLGGALFAAVTFVVSVVLALRASRRALRR